jgi:hypothetical protein
MEQLPIPPRHMRLRLFISEGGSKSGKGSYEYYSGKSGKGAKGGKCKWKYYKMKHDMNIRVESVLSLIFSHNTRFLFSSSKMSSIFVFMARSRVLWKILRHDGEHANYH